MAHATLECPHPDLAPHKERLHAHLDILSYLDPHWAGARTRDPETLLTELLHSPEDQSPQVEAETIALWKLLIPLLQTTQSLRGLKDF